LSHDNNARRHDAQQAFSHAIYEVPQFVSTLAKKKKLSYKSQLRMRVAAAQLHSETLDAV